MTTPITIGNPYPGPPSESGDLETGLLQGPGDGTGLTVHMVGGRNLIRADFDGWGTCVSLEEGAWEMVFDRCFFKGGATGVRTVARNNNITFRDCKWRQDDGGVGLVLSDYRTEQQPGYGTGNLKFRDCKFNSPIVVPPTSVVPVRSIMLDGAQVEQCQDSPIQLHGPWSTWHVIGGYMFRPKDGVSPTIDITDPDGVLILDGVDFGWLPSGQRAIRAPVGTEIVLRDVRGLGAGWDAGPVEWVGGA